MKKLSLFLLLAAIAPALFANNIQVSNVSLTGQNTTNHTTQVQFTLSWDNSWRVSAGPSNWDAAWVFVKYRINSQGPWLHASLNNSGQVAPSGSTIDIGLYKQRRLLT